MTESVSTLSIQRALKRYGFDPGPLDGIMGPKTEQALGAFKRAHGLNPRPYVGPMTLSLLFADPSKRRAALDLPWMNEVAKHMGLHERTNFSQLFSWLKSDGAAVGDPRQLPWCGDLVETAFKLSLPEEPFPGRVGLNPYLARNWLEFGEECPPSYGAVGIFWRGSRTGMSGHVCFITGQDPKRGLLRCRGGNQSNMVSDTWLSGDRLLGYRWPTTYRGNRPALPIMDGNGAVISTNEA
jgi:uncharacterized protein (TIGR02594 family)